MKGLLIAFIVLVVILFALLIIFITLNINPTLTEILEEKGLEKDSEYDLTDYPKRKIK